MRREKKSGVSKIIKIIIAIVLLLILILNVYIMAQTKSKPNSVPSVFGYKPFVVLSGSMETEIYAGDLLIVKEVDNSTLQVDDIIAFRTPDNYVTTHRIIDIVKTEDGIFYETKGDNNNTADDNLVSAKSVEGKYHSKFSKVGYIVLFIQEPLGFAVMMLALFIVCIFIYLFENRRINNDMIIKDEKELKEFEEFKKAKELAKQEEQNERE